MSHQTFWKPEKQVKEKKTYNSLQQRKHKERKEVPEWKKDILSHHISKSEAKREGDEMLAKAFKECVECGWSDFVPVRTSNCPKCEMKGSLVNRPEQLKKSKERLCECGCGATVYAPKRFVSGHNGKLKIKEGTYQHDGRSFSIITCTTCEKKFERRTDQINQYGLKNYCSRKCMGASQSLARKGKPIPSLRKGHYRKCKQCDTEFYAKPSDIAKNGGKFCSKDCFNVWQIDHPAKNFIGSADNRGARNGRYKDGKRVGEHVNKKKLREKVIARDGGNWCLLCGTPGPGLHLHRIVYGSQCGKYELDNCVQLCYKHHDLVHSNKRLWQSVLLEYIQNGNRDKIAETFLKTCMESMPVVVTDSGNSY